MLNRSLSKFQWKFIQPVHKQPMIYKFFRAISDQRSPETSRLYRRLTALGKPEVSVVPILEQWLAEGNKVNQEELQGFIKSMKTFGRFSHALELSHWMTDRRYIPPSIYDMEIRLYLIYKVHGLEKAEEYFANISQALKGFDVHHALLKCYVEEKSVGKAEGVMQKIRDMGPAMRTLPYNTLLSLYAKVGSREKLHALMDEMKGKGIYANKHTFVILLDAYADASDRDGVDLIMRKMESDPRVVIDSRTCIMAALAHLKVGLVDKAVEMLRKLEEVRRTSTNRTKQNSLNCLLRCYAEIGNKEELYRIWNIYKSERLFNMGYMTMINSLLKFDDIEGAEKIFEEWKSRQDLSYDFRIPDLLIDAYVKDGHMGKAEALLKGGMQKGGETTINTWLYLARGYIEDDQVPKAIEALQNVASTTNLRSVDIPIKDKLTICWEYLEKRRHVDDAGEFFNSLKEGEIFSATACEKLLSFIKG